MCASELCNVISKSPLNRRPPTSPDPLVLVVSGEDFDPGLNFDAGSSDRIEDSLEDSTGSAPCLVNAAKSLHFTCNNLGAVPLRCTSSYSSSNDGGSSQAGVVPVRVEAEGFGWAAGPSFLPLFTVQHQLFNVTPNAGSLDEEPTAGLKGSVWSNFKRSVEQATKRFFKWIVLGAVCARSPKVS